MSQSNTSWLPVAMTTTAGTPAPAYCDVTDRAASLFMPVVYALVFCLGFPGNVLALAVLWRRGVGRLKPAMRVYMLNLAAADTLFALTLPAWGVYYARGEDWPLSEPLCRAAGALYYTSTYCGVSFLTVIAINRYRSLTLTLTPPFLPVMKGRGAVCVCAFTWLTWLACAAASLATTQSLAQAGEGGQRRCFRDVDPRWALAACGFSAVAFLLVLASYLSILGSLGVATSRRGAHRRRAAFVVLGMLLVFLSCVLPYHGGLAAWAWQSPPPVCPPLTLRLSTALFSTTCCLDPMVYCFSLRHFRREARRLLLSVRATPSPSLHPPPYAVQGAPLAMDPKSSSRTFSS